MPPASSAPPAPPATDPRVAAYCAPDGPEVFSGIVHGNQVWVPDAFDVDAVHAEARAAFGRLLARASGPELPPTGKSLLLLGEAGSGKTHLMRAFRGAAHADGSGYCGYLQMLSRSDNYPRYVLSYLIDSLEQPYRAGDPTTGLARLARGLLDAIGITDADREKLCDDILDPEEAARIVFRFADVAVQDLQFAGIDINVLRAVLFLLPNDGRIRPKVLNWLRCEELSAYDRDVLGGLVPRPGPEMPLKTIVDLGRLMHAVHSAALVLLVDQMDEMIELARGDAQPGEQFRSAVNALVDVADALPNAVVVIGCLEDLFDHAKRQGFLPRPKLDRLEHDPDPIRLAGKRSADEIRAILARRLDAYFDNADIATVPGDAIAPYDAVDLAPLAGMRTRDVLDYFREHRARCVKAGAWVAPGTTQAKSEVQRPQVTDFAKLWNDFHPTVKPPTGDEDELAGLLAWAISAASDEMPHGLSFGADPDDRFVQVEVQSGNSVDRLLVALCDKSARGGGLGKQIEEVVKRCDKDFPAVFVRSTDFPKTPTAEVAKQVAKLCAPVGHHRRHVVANADWRAMTALRAFEQAHGRAPGFGAWRSSDRPLASLAALRKILDLDKLEQRKGDAATGARAEWSDTAARKEPAVGEGSAVAPPMSADRVKSPRESVALGRTRGAAPSPVALPTKSLCRHAAFLGGPGSGKTTAALAMIEQLLLAGIPAVLLDRKGDLARYADPTAWAAPESDAGRAALRANLRASLDVALFTPGAERGRPLAIPVVPPDLARATAADREQVAQFVSANLGVMMGYKSRGIDPKLVILQKAIELLAAAPGASATASAIQQLVKEQDDALISQLDGQYETKHFNKLATDLYSLRATHKRILEGAEALDVDVLLGRGAHAAPGKTRLSIINTQSLGDSATVDFWVSQFLIALERWRVKNPAAEGALQAVFLFDEADAYLPAVGKPATKGPMEGLLKRARSAGLGLFLATQSPGDFDYKCRDQVLSWLVGRVKEPVAIGKLKPMLEARPGAADKLADQKTGEFYLVRESDVLPVQVARNLIPTEQLPEARILELARAGAPR